MRAFGPGSISSFLKVALDVAHALLWAAAAALAASAALALLWQPFLGPRPSGAAALGPLAEADALLRRGPLLALLVAAGGLYLAGLIVTADRLRRVFGAMAAGDPFHPDNVGRLRTAAAALLGVYACFHLLRWVGAAVSPRVDGRPDLNLSGLFVVLVTAVLAEVFREGARLRAEAELTV